MPIPTSLSRFWIILVALLGAHSAFAQTDSALGGRIVHVYLPSDEIDTLILRNWSLPTKKTGKYWYTVTLQGDKYNSNQGFFFANPRSDRFIMKTGFLTQEVQTARFMVDDFQGKNEMWIIFDPSSPITATPHVLLEPPKIINILNPWETTGPRIVLPGGTFKSMVTRSDRCGWFMAFLLKPTEMNLHFQELNGTDTYGTGGQGNAGNFDMAAQFADKGIRDTLGIELWLDTDINSWLPTYPNKDGNCQYMMAATVRDFSKNHPDFEHPQNSYVVVPGIVEPTIGPDRKPVRTTKTAPWPIFNDFASWWRTDSTAATPAANRSYETCVDIPMSKSSDGLWEYDSYPTPERGFYPIDNFNRHNETVTTCSMSPSGAWSNQTALHNMNFCMESHATFIYQKGQKFEFRGDDDVWVYINNKLVIDLGGLHIPVSDTVDLDTLGLTPGQTYNWDFFYCERQPCGSSLRIKTSIFFKQQKALEAVPDPSAPGTFKIIKREGGKGSCAGQGEVMTEVPATNLIYQLWDATGKIVDTTLLANLPKYNGSIAIRPASATPRVDAQVKVDTSVVVTTLPPGNYRIVAIDAVNQKVRAEVPYKVVARNQVMIHAPLEEVKVPLGTLVRVILANKFNGSVVTQAQSYAPSYLPGLLVYLDSNRTPATPSAFTTDGTGFDTLWVTDTTMAATDKLHTLTVPGTTPILKITFVVPKNKVELEPPANAGNHLLGTLVRVTAANREDGKLVPKADPFTLIIPAGLTVYSDSGKTPVSGTTVLTTAATGFDTVWVTSTVAKDTSYVLGIAGSGKTVTITFLTPKDRMEFDAPHARDTLYGSLVRLTLANRENGTLKPKAQEYALNIPAGLEVYTDAAKTNKVAGGTRLTSAPDGLDTLWVTADSVANNYQDKPFTLEIVAGLKPMVLTFKMPPLVLPKAVTASIFDEDGDGIGDRLTVTYDRDITGNLPKQAEYRWPAATTPPEPITDLAGKVSGTTLTHRGPMTQAPATGGDGIFVSTYEARNAKHPQAIAIHDRIGPILTKAEILLGATADTLRLKFSEPINTAAITAVAASLFSYKILPDADPVSFTPDLFAWDADRQGATLVFPNPSSEAPKAGNFIRINDGPGFIADANGNTAGPASQFRRIMGQKRLEIQTVTYRKVALPDALLREARIAPSQQPLGSAVKDVVEKTGRMGHLIKTDLGDYAVGENLAPLPPSQVALEYSVSYFTNHGVPVASDKRTLFCNDQVFQGDCLKHRGDLFVGWNYTSQDGGKIGTGAYVARIRYQVKVAGEVRENGGMDQVWGVLRQD